MAGFARLWGFSVGFYGVWLAHVGRQTGILGMLARGPITIGKLISESKMDRRAVQAWCVAAISYRLVHEKNGRMYLRPGMESMLLDKKSPNYLGGQFSYLALRSLEYGTFGELFKSGKTCEISTLEAIEQATDWDHYSLLAEVKHDKKLYQLLTNGCRMLDVGCGTGSLIAKMHDAYPRSHFVGIDSSAKAVTRAHKIAKPFKIMKLAAESMIFENEFDIVYLGESLYATRDKGKVMSNCWRALKKDGSIVIVEGLLPETNLQRDDNRPIIAMQLDFVLQGNSFMTRKEIIKLLRRFTAVRFKYLGGSVYLITAHR